MSIEITPVEATPYILREVETGDLRGIAIVPSLDELYAFVAHNIGPLETLSYAKIASGVVWLDEDGMSPKIAKGVISDMMENPDAYVWTRFVDPN